MKLFAKISLILALVAFAMPRSSADTIPQDDAYGVFIPISKYMASGDAEKLSAWFAENLEINLFGVESDSSKTQAKRILARFFDEHAPSSFTIIHKTGRANMKYALGRYVSGSENFDVTVFVSLSDGTYRIRQIKIDKAD
ncbi:MAG: DUF4783 domain-containing protein [Bacteroidales bacterium]|nr:DUF4783 domain-containing protein [Bacteroidales bacterium]